MNSELNALHITITYDIVPWQRQAEQINRQNAKYLHIVQRKRINLQFPRISCKRFKMSISSNILIHYSNNMSKNSSVMLNYITRHVIDGSVTQSRNIYLDYFFQLNINEHVPKNVRCYTIAGSYSPEATVPP